MDVHPWDLWTAGRLAARPWTPRDHLDARDGAAKSPRAAGRQSPLHPRRRGVARIRSARSRRRSGWRRWQPGPGHLVHMPAHIYMRVGRSNEPPRANRNAIGGGRPLSRAINPPGLLSDVHGAQPPVPLVGVLDGRAAARRRCARRARDARRHRRPTCCGRCRGFDFVRRLPDRGRWCASAAGRTCSRARRRRPTSRTSRGAWHAARAMASGGARASSTGHTARARQRDRATRGRSRRGGRGHQSSARRCCRSPADLVDGRDRRASAARSTTRCTALERAVATEDSCATTSRRTGTSRCATCSARCCCDAERYRQAQKVYETISTGTARTAGRCTGLAKSLQGAEEGQPRPSTAEAALKAWQGRRHARRGSRDPLVTRPRGDPSARPKIVRHRRATVRSQAGAVSFQRRIRRRSGRQLPAPAERQPAGGEYHQRQRERRDWTGVVPGSERQLHDRRHDALLLGADAVVGAELVVLRPRT